MFESSRAKEIKTKLENYLDMVVSCWTYFESEVHVDAFDVKGFLFIVKSLWAF